MRLAVYLSALLSSVAFGAAINKCKSAGYVAMTFDNGPGDYTYEVLDALKSSNVTATFHIQTNYFTDPNVVAKVKAISAAGHLVGIAGDPNTDFRSVSTDDLVANFDRAALVIAYFTNYMPKLVRLPYGKYDARVVSALETAGYIVTEYNLDSFDYTVNTADKIYQAFQLAFALYADGAGNFISLQHDAVEGNSGAIEKIVVLANSKSYKVVRLDTCLGIANQTETTTSVALPSGSLLPTVLTGTPSTTNKSGGIQQATSAASSVNAGIFQFIAAVLAVFSAYLFFV